MAAGTVTLSHMSSTPQHNTIELNDAPDTMHHTPLGVRRPIAVAQPRTPLAEFDVNTFFQARLLALPPLD